MNCPYLEFQNLSSGDRRDRVVIATKFGLSDVSQGGYTVPVNGRPEYMRSAGEASLQRLGVETID